MAIEEHARQCQAVFVVDECRRTGAGIADAAIAQLAEAGYEGRMASARAADTYIPLGPAANLAMVQDADVVNGVLQMVESKELKSQQ